MARWRFLRRAVSLGSALCLVVGCLVFLGATGSSAGSATFYVDNTALCPGSGTQASPWCDFSAVDSTIFHPGDQILLKHGDTFTTGMLLQGSGTSTSSLTVSAYGSGATPIINGGNSLSFTGLNLVNTNYVQVENLSFENSGIGALINSGESTTDYRLLDLSFSGDDIGIQSTGSGTASNILVQDVEGVSNTLSCSSIIYPCAGSTLALGGVSNVMVNRLYSSGNCGETDWGFGQGASNVVVENSESIDDASSRR